MSSAAAALPLGIRARCDRSVAQMAFVLFVIALSASLPVGILYWLMRPIAFPNPGISAYSAPRSDPPIRSVPSGVYESYALSITAAKRENEQLHGKSRKGLAAGARQQSRGSVAVVMAQPTRQRSARKQRPQSPLPTVHDPRHFWASGSQGFGMWYR
jgi:hypothetical protein